MSSLWQAIGTCHGVGIIKCWRTCRSYFPQITSPDPSQSRSPKGEQLLTHTVRCIVLHIVIIGIALQGWRWWDYLLQIECSSRMGFLQTHCSELIKQKYSDEQRLTCIYGWWMKGVDDAMIVIIKQQWPITTELIIQLQLVFLCPIGWPFHSDFVFEWELLW